MAVIGNCCFIFNLKDATIIIGYLSLGIAFAGEITAILNMLGYLHLPVDPLGIWILHALFFLGIYGIVFHAVLLLVSVILICGTIKDVPPLLIPWTAWSPFVLLSIIINIALLLEKDSTLAIPIMCFAVILFILIIYATLVVASHYRELIKHESRLRFINNEYPYGERGPRFQRFIAMFYRDKGITQSNQVDRGSDVPASSVCYQPETNRPTIRDVLSRSYARILMAKQLSPPPPAI